MDAEIDPDSRPEPPLEGDEPATLTGFLAYQRATLIWKTSRLRDDELRIARPPSTITLGGLLKHVARVEDYWFTEVVAEHPKAGTVGERTPRDRSRLRLAQGGGRLRCCFGRAIGAVG